jgi:biopolymer transport protein ExbB
MWEELARSFQSGNIYIILLLVLAFISLAIVIERFIMLQFFFNLNYTKFLKELRSIVVAEDIERAMNLCKQASKTSLPYIALKALQAHENDPKTVKGVLEEDTIEFIPLVENRLSSLPVIATLMMLLGLLGTMDGLWWAFHSIDILDTAKKQASLSTGIAASLHPTTIALMGSMILLSLHQMLKGIAIRILERTNHGVTVLQNLLVPTASTIPQAQQEAVSTPKMPASIPETEERPDSKGELFDNVVDDINDEEEII